MCFVFSPYNPGKLPKNHNNMVIDREFMNISSDLSKFHLHDSSLEYIVYSTETMELTFGITLCAWSGDANKDEIYGEKGELIFCNTNMLVFDESILKAILEKGGEVLHLRYEPTLDIKEKDLEGVSGLIQIGMLHDNYIANIQFLSHKFEWIALKYAFPK